MPKPKKDAKADKAPSAKAPSAKAPRPSNTPQLEEETEEAMRSLTVTPPPPPVKKSSRPTPADFPDIVCTFSTNEKKVHATARDVRVEGLYVSAFSLLALG